MSKLVLHIAVLAFTVFNVHSACGQVQTATSQTTGVLGAGTQFETAWFETDSGVPGPTVLVLGGIHGNEPAGYRAAEQIRHWPIESGKLIVIPRVNRLGLAANTRWIPEFRNDRTHRDLNRNFPTNERREAQTDIGLLIWEFAKLKQPDWVFDLHEGFDFHRLNSKSVGSSVIAFPDDTAFAQALVDWVNIDIAPDRRFDLLDRSGPINGSFARACKQELGTTSFIIETTFKDQPLSTRTRQHRRIVSSAFQRIGLTTKDCSDVLVPTGSDALTTVGVFDGAGASEKGVIAVLDGDQKLVACHLGPAEMRLDILKQFDVIIFPGGSGGKQGRAIGESGRSEIRQFVNDGGGLVGICAGAYLCSSHYSWSFDLMNASVFNQMVDIPGKGRKSMWYRGGASDVEVEITQAGSHVMGLDGLHTIRYQNGPIFSPGNHPDAPAYQELAFFRTENGIYDAQKNTMIGAPAVMTSVFGNGRVLAISPHFESTKGKRSALTHAIEYVSNTAHQD